jgi:hypothetical protein
MAATGLCHLRYGAFGYGNKWPGIMTPVRITSPDGNWLTREAHPGEVLVFLTLGYHAQDAAERLARFAIGQAVSVGQMMWRLR